MKQFIEVTNGMDGETRQLVNTAHIAHVYGKDSLSEQDISKMEAKFPHGNCALDLVMGLQNETYVVGESYAAIKAMLAD